MTWKSSPRSRGTLVLSILALVVSAVSACGSSDESTNPSSLTPRLLPSAQFPKGFTVERPFKWDNPIDAVGEGIFLPQATHPSEAVDVLKRANFKAGAGELLTTKAGENGPQIVISAYKLGSTDEARKVQAYLHKQDLQQPCFQVCSEAVSELRLSGIPGATAVKQVPQKHLPKNAPSPFDHYIVEFTAGPYLYTGDIFDGPHKVSKARFEKGAQDYYQHVRNLKT